MHQLVHTAMARNLHLHETNIHNRPTLTTDATEASDGEPTSHSAVLLPEVHLEDALRGIFLHVLQHLPQLWGSVEEGADGAQPHAQLLEREVVQHLLCTLRQRDDRGRARMRRRHERQAEVRNALHACMHVYIS